MSSILRAANNLSASTAANPNFFYVLHPDASKHWFGEDTKLARLGVHGDGSCAYHSICAALNVDDYNHRPDAQQKEIAYKFRCSFADKLTAEQLRQLVKKSKSKSPVRLEEIQTTLCNPKIWADEITLRLMSETLDLNIIFLDMSSNKMYCGVHHDKAFAKKLPLTIIVLWIGHAHFEPLARILKQGPHVSEVTMIFDPSNKHDAALIEYVMQKYKTQCKL